jgi:outer membrane protein OmpA-like peptidoglycan-associated protein
VATTPKQVLPTKLKFAKPKPISAPIPPKKITATDTSATVSMLIRRLDVEPPPAIKPGVTLILHTMQFEQSSYVLLPEASTELNKLIQSMNANPQWRIHIAGHTDNVGDPRLNLALSEYRAKVVAAYLTRRGIADGRITTEGLGSKQPLSDNTTESERSKNRRVEITIR